MKNSKHYNKASTRIAKRRKARATLKMSARIFLVLFVLVGTAFLLRANFLQVKDFQISGTETLPAENIKSFASDFASGTKMLLVPKSNIILLNKNNLASAILSRFKKIEKVDVSKNLLNGNITLVVTERQADFLWCAEDGACYNMTKDGLVFENSANLGGKIIFRGILTGDPVMKNFTSAERMKNYFNFIEILKTNDLIVSSINIEFADKAVAATNKGDIYFDPDAEDLSVVAENVILLVKEIESKNSSSAFQYIDARFGNKIFYK